MTDINLDLIIEFAKTQNLDIQGYTDDAIKATPSKYIYNVTDNNVIDCTPTKYFMMVNPLSLTLVHVKTKSKMCFGESWRKFLVGKGSQYISLILDEIKHKLQVVKNSIYSVQSQENQQIKDEKSAILNQIEAEVLNMLSKHQKNQLGL